MRLLSGKGLLGLLAWGSLLFVDAYPSHPLGLSPADTSTDGHVSTAHTKRTVIDLTNWGQGKLGTTWFGFVQEPANSGWDENAIATVAMNAYEQTQCGGTQEAVIVAALWVQKVGVYLATQPHGTLSGGRFTAQAAFDGMCKASAPVLWHQVADRTKTGNTKWHAEDAAMYFYESEQHPSGLKYPSSLMVTFGRYDTTVKQPGFVPPCGGPSSESGKLNPSCKKVLSELGISTIM